MTWRIVYTDGTEDTTPAKVDKVKRSVDQQLLLALSSHNYGPDEVIRTYPLANIRYWEKVR